MVHTWIFNLIVALPLQLLIVGPIARGVLGKMQKTVAKVEETEAETKAAKEEI